ncbi:hypothetical protein ACIHFC_28785 [Streptomyces sp. NPDC052013]|uniref:hypothetical protein n=1 Tax=Streptomyces sp. NPDC052013 TaxID=3365679 RepID=UPI0037D6C8AA
MTEVIAGQSVTLLAQWYAYESGPLTDLDATPSIKITSIATGTTVLAATTTGVTHPGTGSYGYAWTPAAGLTPGSYLVQWSGLEAGTPVSATETVTVEAPLQGRIYATLAQLTDYLDPEDPPANAGKLLRSASKLLDSDFLRAAVYDVDDAGMPTDPDVQTAFAEAVCAQVEFWGEVGEETDIAGPLQGVAIGSVQLQFGAGDNRSGPDYYAPRLIRELLSIPADKLRWVVNTGGW